MLRKQKPVNEEESVKHSPDARERRKVNGGGHLRSTLFLSGGKKDPQNHKFARTAPKNFLNNSRALPVITQ